MRTVVYLVRHGETEWNVLGKFQGCKDIELSTEGINQAKFVANALKGKFDVIFSSPLKRALKTGEIIARCSNLEINVENELREINFGDWEGLTVNEIRNQFPNQFQEWTTDLHEGPICGGELSIKNAVIRAKTAIMSNVQKNKEKKIVIVAHGGIIKAGIIGIFGWNVSMYHKMVLGNTAICELSFDDEMNPKIVMLNNTSHLPNEYEVKSYV